MPCDTHPQAVEQKSSVLIVLTFQPHNEAAAEGKNKAYRE
jgi:hypothetical protein